MTLHTDRELNHQLEVLRGRLLRMAGLVETMIDDSVRALMEVNVELARQTIARDHQVNRIEVETDEQCLLIIARWQPVASDLRFVALALKMVTDLERIGDLAVNIAKRAIELNRYGTLPMLQRIGDLGTAVRAALRDAFDALARNDVALAERVIEEDTRIDR